MNARITAVRLSLRGTMRVLKNFVCRTCIRDCSRSTSSILRRIASPRRSPAPYKRSRNVRNVSASGSLRCQRNRCEKSFKLGFGIDVRNKGRIDALAPSWHRRPLQQTARDSEEKQTCQRTILLVPSLITRRASVHETRDHLRIDIPYWNVADRSSKGFESIGLARIALAE